MSEQQITETDRDNLCDILWWLKGYKKGADDSLETCEFNEDHLQTLDKVVRHLREVLNPPTKQTEPAVKKHSPDDMDGMIIVANKLLRESIKIWFVRTQNDTILYSNFDSKYFDVQDWTGDLRVIPGKRIN